MKKFLQQLLTEEHANSRFIFLVTGLTICACVVALVMASIIKGSSANALVLDAYVYLVGVLLSGGVGSSVGRWLTGKKSPQGLPVDSSETKTVTISEKIVGSKAKNPKLVS